MQTSTLARLGGVLAASVLTLSLSACSGQSVAVACLQTNVALAESNKALGGDFEDRLEGAMTGEDVDFTEIFAPVRESLERAQNEVSNDEVSEAFDAYVEEIESYMTTLENIDFAAFAAFNDLDPSSTEYAESAEEIEAESLELQEALEGHMAGVVEADDALGAVCDA